MFAFFRLSNKKAPIRQIVRDRFDERERKREEGRGKKIAAIHDDYVLFFLFSLIFIIILPAHFPHYTQT